MYALAVRIDPKLPAKPINFMRIGLDSGDEAECGCRPCLHWIKQPLG